ncbi:Vegetative incompatibility protein HET-E-1 [Apiospora kogelbergensis]|uniref:Vegetative incompatibility protein HET-E-1 n=1 Tax=Apiospora kogelbergensis TaxID=1337665 RepID=A0AAW0QNZ5_9PEZI
MASPKLSSLVVQKQRDPLLEAIGNFQAALSDRERDQLKNMGAVPKADDIMVFTAELDFIHRQRTGPSYASRLHTVLMSVGVFCSVVDTFISSHPEIAALVWGGVKLTMLVAANVASYYQPTSDLFMKLGRLCPLFADYQALYPGSIRLQGALANFDASIIRCCGHVIKTLRRPLHQQLFNSLLVSFEQEFKPDLDDIQRYSDSVMQEIQFAKAQADRQDQQLQSTGTRPSNSNEILRSILQQRLDSTHVTDQLEILLRQLDDLQDTVELLRHSISRSTSYIIIDGIDECQISDRRELLAVLSSLISSNGNIRLFLSGRISVQDEIKAYFNQHFHISLDCEATSQDITRYIDAIIDKKVEDGDLCVGDPVLVDEVKRALAGGAQGMFLWAHFQVEEISFQPSDASIRAALDNLPKDLSEVFNRALRRIKEGSHLEEAQEVFRWVAAAKRPLSLEELREAIAIRDDQQFSEPARHCNDMNKISKWCENLVEVEEESEVVQFIHHSVQTFLLGNFTEPTLVAFHVDLDQATCKLGKACLTYLDFNDFKRSLLRNNKSHYPNIKDSHIRIPLPEVCVCALAFTHKKSPKRRIQGVDNSTSGCIR